MALCPVPGCYRRHSDRRVVELEPAVRAVVQSRLQYYFDISDTREGLYLRSVPSLT